MCSWQVCISVQLNLLPKTSCLEKHIWILDMADQDMFYCTNVDINLISYELLLILVTTVS